MKLETLQEARHITQTRLVRVKIDQNLIDAVKKDYPLAQSFSDQEVVKEIDNFLRAVEEQLPELMENLDWFNY